MVQRIVALPLVCGSRTVSRTSWVGLQRSSGDGVAGVVCCTTRSGSTRTASEIGDKVYVLELDAMRPHRNRQRQIYVRTQERNVRDMSGRPTECRYVLMAFNSHIITAKWPSVARHAVYTLLCLNL